jgi:hypothetical protein
MLTTSAVADHTATDARHDPSADSMIDLSVLYVAWVIIALSIERADIGFLALILRLLAWVHFLNSLFV